MLEIINTSNKNAYLYLKNQVVVVKRPPWMNQILLDDFISKHGQKLCDNLKKSQTFLDFQSQTIQLWGRAQRFEILCGFSNQRVLQNGEKIFLYTSDGTEAEIKACLEKFCFTQLSSSITSWLWNFEKAMNLKSHTFSIKNLKTIWGSNHTKNQQLKFNLKLIHFPLEVIKYVIVHELAHDFFPNHSKNFWNKVQDFCPQYKLCRRQLKTASF